MNQLSDAPVHLCLRNVNATRSRASRHRGAVLMMLVILLPILFMLAAFAINIAYIEMIDSEAQITADACAKAAGRAYMIEGTADAALDAARDAATRNTIAGQVIPIDMGDLEFGTSLRASENQTYAFTKLPAGNVLGGNAVRLTTRSLDATNGSVISPVFPTMGVTFGISPLKTATSTQSTMDVALVIDRSGSMAWASHEVAGVPMPPPSAPPTWDFGQPIPPNSRWLDTVASAGQFIAYLESSPQPELLSLSTFATDSRTDAMLTDQYGDVTNALNAISANYEGGSTSLGLALAEGLGALTDPARSRPFAVKVMVLLTDGNQTSGTSPWSTIGGLKSNGVILFTITFSDEANQGLMSNLANQCGGEHFHAVDAASLNDAFDEISKRLPALLTE